MKLLGVFSGALALAVVALIASPASPANAASMTVSSSVSTFTAGASSPGFVLSTNAVTAGVAGQLRVWGITNGSNRWTLDSVAFPNCSTNYYAQSSLSSCGISVAIDGTTLPNTLPAGWSVYWDTSSKFFVFFPPNPYLTQTVGTSITFTFSPGVFSVPNAPGPAFLSVREAGLIGDDSGQTSALNIVVPTVVTFDANGGTGSMNTQSGTTATALTENAFTRTGYTFGGWAATQPEALAGQVAYANGASYPFAATTTLYAIWLVETPDDSGSASGEAASKLPVTGIDFLPVALVALLTALLGIVVAYRSWMRSRNQ